MKCLGTLTHSKGRIQRRMEVSLLGSIYFVRPEGSPVDYVLQKRIWDTQFSNTIRYTLVRGAPTSLRYPGGSLPQAMSDGKRACHRAGLINILCDK